MKYILICSLFLVACTPTQDQIDAAASHQSEIVTECQIIAHELHGKGQTFFFTPDGPLCSVHIKDRIKQHYFPILDFNEDEIRHITRFLHIQKDLK
jgi:hypothetical protein